MWRAAMAAMSARRLAAGRPARPRAPAALTYRCGQRTASELGTPSPGRELINGCGCLRPSADRWHPNRPLSLHAPLRTVRVSRPAVPGRSDPHSDRPFSVAGAVGCLGGLTRTPIDHDPCLSSDLSTAREHLATRFHLANARDPRRA